MRKDSIIGKCLLSNLLRMRKMSQVDLEVVTGIHRKQINAYIRNERCMSLQNARVIAQALKCHIDDLYEWKQTR